MDYESSLTIALARIDIGDLAGAKIELQKLAENRYRYSPSVQANILGAISLWHKAYGNYRKGLAFAQKAIVLLKQCGLIEEAKNALYTLVGCLQRELGNITEAEAYFTEVLQAREAVLKPEHPDLIIPLSNMGGVALDKGNYANSIQYYERAAAIAIKQYGATSTDTATIQLNLGEVYRAIGQFEKASQLFASAYDSLAKAYGPKSQALISALNNMASLCIELNRYDESTHFLMQAIQILEEKQQLAHPLLGTLYHNLACAYRNLEQYEAAEQLFHKTLTIRLNRLGGDHPLVAVTLNNLGWSYICSNQLDAAQTILDKARQILLIYYGPEHPELCPVLNNLGQLALHRKQAKEAKALFETCIELSIRQGEQHQTNLTIYHHNLADANQLLHPPTDEGHMLLMQDEANCTLQS